MGRRRIDLQAEMVYSQQEGHLICESRAARVSRLKSAVCQGSYRVDTRQVAEVILARVGTDGERKPRGTSATPRASRLSGSRA